MCVCVWYMGGGVSVAAVKAEWGAVSLAGAQRPAADLGSVRARARVSIELRSEQICEWAAGAGAGPEWGARAGAWAGAESGCDVGAAAAAGTEAARVILASCWTRGAGCARHSALKGKTLLKFQAASGGAPGHARTPSPETRGRDPLQRAPGTRTPRRATSPRAQTRSPPHTHSRSCALGVRLCVSVCVRVCVCVRAGGLKVGVQGGRGKLTWAALRWHLKRSARAGLETLSLGTWSAQGSSPF